ncbi:MAG: decaprenyl-phosphate phosphoribosyltransferase [Anaerolineae bacterium]|nr:decaprenyl-phosphate phosphoribosyltransferase [Anaerolineae bacterium]
MSALQTSSTTFLWTIVRDNTIGLIKTMRPQQWVKNGFVFAALLFDGQLRFGEWDVIGRTLIAFALFCAISSSVYIMNDLSDIESDRRHPTKRLRPLPSGQVRPNVARLAFFALSLGTLALAFTLDQMWHTTLGWVVLAYFVLQIAYTFRLKHVVLLDVCAIAAGFVLRVAAGVAVIEVARFSPWLYVCTASLALFLALGKRRHELILLGDNAGTHRAILQEYTVELVDKLITLVMTGALVSYSLYTFLAEGLPAGNRMMLTIPFVLYGILRWSYLMYGRGEGGAPDEMVLRDRPLQLALAGWLVTVIFVLYGV